MPEEAGYKDITMKWSSLRFRASVSYALTTLAAVLLTELVLAAALISLLLYSPLADGDFVKNARQTAIHYAFSAITQSDGRALNPHSTFAPDTPSSLTLANIDPAYSPVQVQYISTSLPVSQSIPFVLLIAPNGQILASSYPARYPSSAYATRLLPERAHLITNALAGREDSISVQTSQGRIVGVVEPIMVAHNKLIGAIYLQNPGLSTQNLIPGFAGALLASGIFWLFIMLPVGILFGLLSTRGLTRRIRKLVNAANRFADGDYTQRLLVSRRDEVGQLEQDFNVMAEQLVESIAQRQTLAEQGARQEERARIARDLHDSIKQQVFAVSMQIGAALSLLDNQADLAHKHMLEAETLAYQAQQELSTLIRELRPLALQVNKSLSAALEESVTAWSRQHAIAADLHIAEIPILPMPVEVALLRVAQEALSNIARHSQATRVQVSLSYEHHQAVFSIADNGCGFDANTTDGTGVGLHSMQERMESVNGTLTIESKVGQGTRLVAHSADETRASSNTVGSTM